MAVTKTPEVKIHLGAELVSVGFAARISGLAAGVAFAVRARPMSHGSPGGPTLRTTPTMK